jgi:hypothetical protein
MHELQRYDDEYPGVMTARSSWARTAQALGALSGAQEIIQRCRVQRIIVPYSPTGFFSFASHLRWQ